MINRDEAYKHFRNNASCLVPTSVCEDGGVVKETGYLGYPSSGNPAANDKDGSNFWAERDKLDPIWDTRDSKLAEHELGFQPGGMDGRSYYRFDDLLTDNHNYRVATGHEPGASELFTGLDNKGNVDPAIYNGQTKGGLPEMVSGRTPTKELERSPESKVFTNPNDESRHLLGQTDRIAKMPDGPKKDFHISTFNCVAVDIDSRMADGQNYLTQRIADHAKTMDNNPEGSLEYTRAADNKAWCENYHRELSESRQNLRSHYANLNGGAEMPIPKAERASNRNSVAAGSVTASEIPQPPNPKQNRESDPVGAKKGDLLEVQSPEPQEQHPAGLNNPSNVIPVEESTILKSLSNNKEQGMGAENAAINAAKNVTGGMSNG